MSDDLIGQRFDRLVVLRGAPSKRDKRGKNIPMIVCRCDCGTVKTFHRRNITRGLSGSCGCRTLERAAEAHRALRQEVAGYLAAHYRVRRDRGKAAEHVCPCGRQAQEWAYDHRDPDELVGQFCGRWLVYSLKSEHYVAMCRSCHRRFDRVTRRSAHA